MTSLWFTARQSPSENNPTLKGKKFALGAFFPLFPYRIDHFPEGDKTEVPTSTHNLCAAVRKLMYIPVNPCKLFTT